MRHLHLALTSMIALGAALGCGSLADPSRGGENIATIEGALSAGGEVPAGARVAVVFRTMNTPGLEIMADAPVVGRSFRLILREPGAHLMQSIEGSAISTGRSGSEESSASPPMSAGAAPSPTGPRPATLAPRADVNGKITGALEVAMAGLVVYIDKNGNGKLDATGPDGITDDEVIGGDQELALAYLKGGGELDYEKLRDKTSQKPRAGYNLLWNQARWLPMNLIELKLRKNVGLPSGVCDRVAETEDRAEMGTAPSTSTLAPPFPKPDDPNLVCAADGRSFSHSIPCTAPPSPPARKGLCTIGRELPPQTTACAPSYGSRLAPDQPVPKDWPCKVKSAADAGADGS